MKQLCILLCVGLLSGMVSARAQSYYEEGLKEYNADNGNMLTAVNLFTKAIRGHQEPAQAYLMRGAARGRLQQFSNAAKDLDSSLRLDPDNYKAYMYYGKINLVQGDFSTALHYYDLALSKYTKDPKVYDDRAIVKGNLNRYKDAVADEDMAIALDPQDYNYYLNRGFAKVQLHEDAAAMADYDKSIGLKPSYKGYADRGVLFLQMKQFRRAVDDLTLALQLVPADYDIWYRRGLAYNGLGDTEKACLDFKHSQQMGYALAGEALQKNNCH